MNLNNNEIEKIYKLAASRVVVACDENHTHSALNDCLHGDEKDIIICKLCESIKYDRHRLSEFYKVIQS